MLDRRQFVRGAGAALPALAAGCGRSQKWGSRAYRKRDRSRVAILEAAGYDAPLGEILQNGLELFGLRVENKRVVLKPNLVEADRAQAVNTHPALVAAAIEAFRRKGAREVVVAEGPAHRRDNEYLLATSGLYETLREHKVHYVDLNHDDVRLVAIESRYTGIESLYLPETILAADLVVSMPKLKTHHWAGVTLALKNLFGIVPGAIYGWPKNLLHWAGIHNSVVDIASTLAAETFAIVDGIVGMEGDGPILGQPKRCGVVVLGDDLTAVDATAARLMRIEPAKVEYLAMADEFLGNVAEERIEQVGERLDRFRQDFKVLESFRGLKLSTSQ